MVRSILAEITKEYETTVAVLEPQETELDLHKLLPKLLVVEQRLHRQEEAENKALSTGTGGGRRAGNPGNHRHGNQERSATTVRS